MEEQTTSEEKEPKREFPPLPRLEIRLRKDRQKWWNFLRGMTLDTFVPHPATLDWWGSLSTSQMNQFRREAKEKWGEEGWEKFQLHLRQLRQTMKERARLKRFGKDDSYGVVVRKRFAEQIDSVVLAPIEFAKMILTFAAFGMDLEYLAEKLDQPLSTIREIATPKAIEEWRSSRQLQKAGSELLQAKCLLSVCIAEKLTVSDALRGLKDSGFYDVSAEGGGDEQSKEHREALEQRHAQFAKAVDAEVNE